jgi:hypothetical protein
MAEETRFWAKASDGQHLRHQKTENSVDARMRMARKFAGNCCVEEPRVALGVDEAPQYECCGNLDPNAPEVRMRPWSEGVWRWCDLTKSGHVPGGNCSHFRKIFFLILRVGIALCRGRDWGLREAIAELVRWWMQEGGDR